MADRKSDVDVTELLHKLEELKKKKAQNVKKLKRKLGKTVQLNKPETIAVSAKGESNTLEQKTSFLKLQTQITRKSSSKLKRKNSNLSKSKLADEEQENFPEESIFYAADADSCSSLQSKSNNLNKEIYEDSKLISQLVSGKVSQNRTLNEDNLELKTIEVSKSFTNTENCAQEEFRYFGKRSSDIEKEDIFDSQSNLKRFKLCNGESDLQNKNNLENETTYLFESHHIGIHDKNYSEICKEIIPNSIKITHKKTEASSQNINRNHLFQKDEFVLAELNDRSQASFIVEEVNPAKNLSSDCQSFKTINCMKDDIVHSTNMQPITIFSMETNGIIDSSQPTIDVLESNSSLNYLNKTTHETNTEVGIDPNVTEVGIDPNVTEVGIDPNVTEVADTEIGFVKELQEKVPSSQEKIVDLNSDRKDAVESPLQDSNFKEMSLTDSAYENEDICLKNIQSNVASFEEVRTEIPETEMMESASHFEDNKESIKCDFTDDESDYSKCFDSNELEALCQSDYEKDIENFENESGQNSFCDDDSCSIVNSKTLAKEIQINNKFKNRSNSEPLVTDSDVFVVPETEVFDFASYNESEVDNIGHNVCIIGSEDNKDKRKLENKKKAPLTDDSYSLNSEIIENCGKCVNDQTNKNLNICEEMDAQFDKIKQQTDLSLAKVISEEVDTDSLGTEDFLKLVNYQEMPFQLDKPDETCPSDEQSPYLKFQCSLRSDINEAVTRLKLAYFNNSQYIFIQHITWIQVWRQEKGHEWMKIFAHQVEGFQLQELCLSQSENYLVLVMLLNSEQNSHCLHFLVFERESKLIKLMEHTHWFENKYEQDENIFLCGLDDLKFASAQGSHNFKVYSHAFNCLDGDPRMLTVVLGSTNDSLHSLCRIDKLSNALMGMSNKMLYIWHLLEARLVTSVCLQADSFEIESCVWAIVENGLIFLMVACKENSGGCQLLAANLATGFCEVALTYTLQPAFEKRLPSNRKLISYSEPVIGMTNENGAFIWSVEEEYCCAFLNGSNYTSIVVVPTFGDSFLIILGCSEGCVNCYELKTCPKTILV